ncbi:hypothetical protein [Bradyrhizobium sp. 141]|uniref:hypothetical protein n=1 Tax=Bradyrhizobium sp. 141 TaxID=2782617 RepID=UPI001FFBEE4B|nr:hypothetical protein [Bradyrhizobium sp. 141]MCK1719523.1 hypothetical protein [Bradyrhizobium sp. 141]
MRFDAEQWMDWQATVFWPALRPLFTQLARTSPSVIARAEELSLAAVRMLDAQLSGRMYVAGDSFSSDLVSHYEIALPKWLRQAIARLHCVSAIDDFPLPLEAVSKPAGGAPRLP